MKISMRALSIAPSLGIMMLASTILADTADYYGVFIASKSGSTKELMVMRSDSEAYFSKALENAVTNDAGTYLILFMKDVKPSEYKLFHYDNLLGKSQKTEIDVIVKPREIDKYYIIPRTPLVEGIYTFENSTERRLFIVDGKEFRKAYAKALKISQENGCINNRRQIEAAKEQWAIDTKKRNGEAVVVSEVLAYVKHPEVVTNCPAGGKVYFVVLGINAGCSIHGDDLRE
jgi:hypothetical protein